MVKNGRKLRFAAAIAALACLAACAHTSEVMDTGNGTYMISASAMNIRGGTSGAKEMAYDDAKAYCGQSGKHAVLIDVSTDPTAQGQRNSTDVHFR